MVDFVEVATRDQVPPGKMTSAWAGGRKVLIYNVGGQFYATDEQCPHRECSLELGVLTDKTISCPCHSARFDIETGGILNPPATTPLPTYPVKLQGNRILVGVDTTDVI